MNPNPPDNTGAHGRVPAAAPATPGPASGSPRDDATLNTARTHTITWDDPREISAAVQKLSGLEWLHAIQRGDAPPPPVMTLIGAQPLEAAQGRVVFTLQPAEYHYNPSGVVHGGIISTMLDTAMACAVFSLLPAGVGSTTIELHVNFLRAITVQTGELRCEGEVVHAGRTIATAQGRLLDAAGKLYAHATTTCMIIREA